MPDDKAELLTGKTAKKMRAMVGFRNIERGALRVGRPELHVECSVMSL